MHPIINAIVFAAALFYSYLSLYNNAMRIFAHTRVAAGAGIYLDLWTALAWGLFYYLTH